MANIEPNTTGTIAGDLAKYRGDKQAPSYDSRLPHLVAYLGIAALFAAVAGGAWWHHLAQQVPQEGMQCAKSGEMGVASDGTPVVCQDGVGWKSVK